jgi:hypothetical protein
MALHRMNKSASFGRRSSARSASPFRNRLIGVAAIALPLILAVSTLSPAEAAPAVAVSHEKPVSAVKVLPVPAAHVFKGSTLSASSGFRAETSLGARVLPKPKPITPLSRVRGYQKSTSKVVSRSTYKTVYLNADGTNTDKVSLFPLNVKKSGRWKPIVTKLKKVASSGGYATTGQPLKARFAAKSGSKADYTVTTGKHALSFHLDGERSAPVVRPSRAEVEESGQPGATTSLGVAYDAVLPKTDLSYQVDSSGVKEALILHSAPSDPSPTYSWTVNAPGLTLVAGPAGSVLYKDASGTTVLETPTPLMTDSSGIQGESFGAVDTIPITYADQGDGNWVLTLTPDASWLNDSARVYPVTLDPSTISPAAGQIISYESSNGSDLLASEPYANIGNSQSNGPSVWRTVAYYKYESLFGKHVVSSGLGEAYDGAGATTAEGVQASQASKWGFQCQGSTRASTTFSSGTSGGATLNVTSIMSDIVDSGVSGTPLCLTGDETLSAYTYKQITTAVSITYEAEPTVALTHVGEPDADGFADVTSSPNGTVGSRTPVFSVATTEDSYNGSNATAVKFAVFSDSGMTTPVWAPGWTSSKSVQMPSGRLQPGTKYFWQVQVKDAAGGTNASPAYSWTTSTDPTAGTAPTTPADNSIAADVTPARRSAMR